MRLIRGPSFLRTVRLGNVGQSGALTGLLVRLHPQIKPLVTSLVLLLSALLADPPFQTSDHGENPHQEEFLRTSYMKHLRRRLLL